MTDAMAVARAIGDRMRGRTGARFGHVGAFRESDADHLEELIAAALREREQAVWREAANLVDEFPNGMQYGPGVDDRTVNMVEASIDALREEIAKSLRARATPPPRAGREGEVTT